MWRSTSSIGEWATRFSWLNYWWGAFYCFHCISVQHFQCTEHNWCPWSEHFGNKNLLSALPMNNYVFFVWKLKDWNKRWLQCRRAITAIRKPNENIRNENTSCIVDSSKHTKLQNSLWQLAFVCEILNWTKTLRQRN